MPNLIRCPSCNRQLRVPENLLGKKVKCPACQGMFTAKKEEEDLPTAPLIEEEESPPVAKRRPPAPPAEEEEEPQPPVAKKRRPTLRDDEGVGFEEVPPEEEGEEEAQGEMEPRPRRRRRLRSSRDASLASLKAPAICLLVTGILGCLVS